MNILYMNNYPFFSTFGIPIILTKNILIEVDATEEKIRGKVKSIDNSFEELLCTWYSWENKWD